MISQNSPWASMPFIQQLLQAIAQRQGAPGMARPQAPPGPTSAQPVQPVNAPAAPLQPQQQSPPNLGSLRQPPLRQQPPGPTDVARNLAPMPPPPNRFQGHVRPNPLQGGLNNGGQSLGSGTLFPRYNQR